MALATNTNLVGVDHDALEALATRLADGDLVAPDWRLPVYPEGDDSDFVQFLGIQNALNFCFANPVNGEKYGVLYHEIMWGGATGLCAALLRAVDEGRDLRDVGALAYLHVGELDDIFRSDDALLPLMAERCALLNSLPASLAVYDGRFANVIEACDFDAGRLVARLVEEFPAYGGDQWLHPTSKHLFSFDKRARLFALMYEGRARASNGALRTLTNLESVGPPVDYQLPRALRSVDVLSYGPRLAYSVDNDELLAPGSIEELTIRHATERAINELLGLVNERLFSRGAERITMVELDYALWVAGRKAGGRPHLCLTTAY